MGGEAELTLPGATVCRLECDAWFVLARAKSVVQQARQRAGVNRAPSGVPAQPAGLVGATTATGVGRGLQRAIRGQVFVPGQPAFESAAHVFNRRFDDVLPIAVGRPADARDVRDAIRFTVAQGVRVRARSGGHSYAGYSTLPDGVVLDPAPAQLSQGRPAQPHGDDRRR